MAIAPRIVSMILVPTHPRALHTRAAIVPWPTKRLRPDQITSRHLGPMMSQIGCPNASMAPPPQQRTSTNRTMHFPNGKFSPWPLVPLHWTRTTISPPMVYTVSSGNRLAQPLLPSLISVVRYGTWLGPIRSNRAKTTGWWPPYNPSLNRSSGVRPTSPPLFNGMTPVLRPLTTPPAPLPSLRRSNTSKRW
jgi:hypothetical protein